MILNDNENDSQYKNETPMTLHLTGLLGEADLALAKAVFQRRDAFRDGRSTAGAKASRVKKNLQADERGLAGEFRKLLEKRLLAHPLFWAAARPKAIVRLLLSKYEAGMRYGLHVDEALMDGQRTDLSFTLFLNDPQSYEGGALMIDEPGGQRAIKLPAGSLLLYPSSTLHQVEKVAKGERWAAVGWLRSYIRDGQAREILFDLARVKQGLANLPDAQLQLDRVEAALLRRWVED